jgi:hypothetical protein
MNTLHLTLKKKWFDMIASGEKKEEYRERKPYWYNRLTSEIYMNAGTPTQSKHFNFIKYDAVKFVNGYGNHRPSITLECKNILVNFGKPEWGGDANNLQFVIKLGDVIK